LANSIGEKVAYFCKLKIGHGMVIYIGHAHEYNFSDFHIDQNAVGIQ
jgi:hypothetical protein